MTEINELKRRRGSGIRKEMLRWVYNHPRVLGERGIGLMNKEAD